MNKGPFLMVSGMAFTKQAQRASANEWHIGKKKRIVFLECLWGIKGNDSLEWVVWRNLPTEVITKLKHKRWERNSLVKLVHPRKWLVQKFWGQKKASVLEKQKRQGLCKGWKDGPYHPLIPLLSVLSEAFAPLLYGNVLFWTQPTWNIKPKFPKTTKKTILL